MSTTRMGHAVHTRRRGPEDGRAVLALHCTLGSGGYWDAVFEGLAPEGAALRIEAPDFPGHGQSGPWNAAEAPDYQRLAVQIAASHVTRPVDLVGHSFGAVVALRLAVAAPEAVRSLTLVEPVLFAALPPPARAALAAQAADLAAGLRAGAREEVARAFLALWGSGAAWEDLPEAQRARFAAQMDIVAAVGAANLADPGAILRPGGLEGLAAPVMIVTGEAAPAACAEVGEAIAARLGDVGVARVPGAGHMLPLTHPQALRDLVALNLERA